MAPYHPPLNGVTFLKSELISLKHTYPSQWPTLLQRERTRAIKFPPVVEESWIPRAGVGAIASTPTVTSPEPRPLSGWGEKVYRSRDLYCNAWPRDQCFWINFIVSSATAKVMQMSASISSGHGDRHSATKDELY